MPSLYTDSQTLALKVLSATIPTIVALATCLRLWIRGRDRWWVDDLLATLGVLVMIEHQAVFWALSMYQPPTLPVFYVLVLSGQTMIWLSRGSILASVIRIMPGGPLRVGALYVSGLFVVFYVMIVAQYAWVCEANEKLDIAGVPRCIITKQVPILQTSVAMISDALLIFLPLRTLRELKNQPGLRRRLQFIFTASALTTCASIVSGVFNWLNIGFGYLIVVEIELWLSLVVCNVTVLAIAFLKFIRRYSRTTLDGTVHSSRRRHQQSLLSFSPIRTGRDSVSEERSRDAALSNSNLTTIDLGLSDMSTGTSTTRTKSSSPSPTAMFDGQQVDSVA